VIPVRLSEVRREVRVSAALRLARKEEAERLALLSAALQPSNTVYYLPDRVEPLLKRYAA
jgi:hypothetical protein